MARIAVRCRVAGWAWRPHLRLCAEAHPCPAERAATATGSEVRAAQASATAKAGLRGAGTQAALVALHPNLQPHQQ